MFGYPIVRACSPLRYGGVRIQSALRVVELRVPQIKLKVGCLFENELVLFALVALEVAQFASRGRLTLSARETEGERSTGLLLRLCYDSMYLSLL